MAVALFVIGSSALPARAQDIGSVFVSANYGFTDNRLDNNFTTHTVDNVGAGFGFFLPVLRSRIGIQYKARVAYHSITDDQFADNPSPDDSRFYRNLDYYLSALNEVMVGMRVDLFRRAYVRPLLGAGVLVHVIYGNHGPGIAYGTFQFDLSTLWMYELKSFDAGILLSLEYVPFDGYFDSADLGYVSVGLVLSK
jgi:hypothetical protein